MSDNNKLVVETVGDIMLQDVNVGQVVEAHRPSLVKRSAFITQRIDNKQLRVVNNDVADDYTDEELAKDWAAGKVPDAKKQPPKAKTAKAVVANKDEKVVIPVGSPKHPTETDAQYKARVDAESK